MSVLMMQRYSQCIKIGSSAGLRSSRNCVALPKRRNAHTLRHGVATKLFAKGAAAHEVMALLGHSQISTTMRYAHAQQMVSAALLAIWKMVTMWLLASGVFRTT